MLGIKNKSAKADVMASIKQSAAYSAFDVENHPEKVVDVITVDWNGKCELCQRRWQKRVPNQSC